jgi:hypothetical protein
MSVKDPVAAAMLYMETLLETEFDEKNEGVQTPLP